MTFPSARPPRWTRTAVLVVVVLQGLLLRDDVVSGQKWKTDFGPCYRDCTVHPEPRLCHYEFTEEIYPALSGACKQCAAGVEADCYSEECVPVDGVERSVYTVNRQLPGPAIHVCVGDVIQVDLRVRLPGHAEAIHWHGLPQNKTPWFDGVAWVTQCPVLFGTTFRYEFVAEPAGTYFWHSHSGLHKVNGVAGVLVIRQPRHDDPHLYRYDEDLPEHTVLLQDWMHVPAEFVFPGLSSRLTGQPSDVLLVNGQGRFTDPASGNTTRTPLATFEVLEGRRYRFRFINSGSLSCPIQVQFEGHKMSVISSDGLDIQPQAATSLFTFSGERWDVVIETMKRSGRRSFWIYVRTVGFCQGRGASEQVAVLVYRGDDGRAAARSTADVLPPTAAPSLLGGRGLPTGAVVNSIGDCGSKAHVCAAELRALQPDPRLRTGARSKADTLVFFRLRFAPRPDEFNKGDYGRFLAFGPTVTLAGVLNDIIYGEPNAPFLTQPGQSHFCNEKRLPRRCKGKDVCECPHLVRVPLGHTVDIVVVDETDLNPGDDSNTTLAHPMHLHGTSFACMGSGTLRNVTGGAQRARAVRELYNNKALPTFVAHPALKDVMALPGGGWIWFRFRADNPGSWFFHCHFQYHMAGGMEAVIQVGDPREPTAPTPPRGFPTCGDFLYSDYDVRR